jgi:SAM-dependent methyltransferase
LFETVHLQEIPTDATFSEAGYLKANPDVAAAVAARELRSGRVHFDRFGRLEGRRQTVDRPADDTTRRIAAMRAAKLAVLAPSFRCPPLAITANGIPSFLSDAMKRRDDLEATDAVSENGYDDETVGLIRAAGDGLVLDVGAGRRPVYFGNVVNYEIVPYETTDILGTGDDLPFRDDTFDGVLSIAVLEHVKDPFKCAAELARVLKPGGWLKCCVPFLQPLHGYPHHYFNMTHEGLRTLFENHLTIERQEVTGPTHPVWSISWQLRSWADGLPPASRKQFLKMRVRDLIAHPIGLLEQPFARDLPVAKQFELAAATILIARKPARA